MPGRLRLVLLAAVALVLLAPAVAWALGELSQSAGPGGCISETGSGGACQDGVALDGSIAVAVSPDGRHAYVAAYNGSAIAILDRDPNTGALAQRAAPGGCVSGSGTGGSCQAVAALAGVADVAVSPDGRNLYATSNTGDALIVFDRDTTTGALTVKAGVQGCITDTAIADCTAGRGLDGPIGVTVSDDGARVYVASLTDSGVATFDRDTDTGVLTQPAGTDGCIQAVATTGCRVGNGLGGAYSVAVSPDGASVYVAGSTSDAIAVFDRAADGLAQKAGTPGCVSETGMGGQCQDGVALDGVLDLAVSPDGKNVYATALESDAVTVFDRAAGGGLTQKGGTAGCVSETGTAGACQDGVALAGAGHLDVSPDGRDVYVTAGVDAGPANAVAAFSRDAASGALAQKPGTAACVSDSGTAGACVDGRELQAPNRLAVSPDGGNVYVAAQVSDAVAVLTRAIPPVSPAAPSTPVVPRDTTAPVVSRFGLSPKRFRVARGSTPRMAAKRRKPAAPRGSRIRFTLSESARVWVMIMQKVPGRRANGRCRAPSKRLRTKARCTFEEWRGTLVRNPVAAGKRSVAFTGRIGTRALAPGSYVATIYATDATGNVARPKRASFSIVRR